MVPRSVSGDQDQDQVLEIIIKMTAQDQVLEGKKKMMASEANFLKEG
jgi:hypothetical protein